MSLLACCLFATGLAGLAESPPNLSEKRVKVMPGFPRDGDLPKPLAKILPPLTVTSPIFYFLYQNRRDDKPIGEHQWLGLVVIGAAHLLMQWAQLHCGRFYTFDRSIKEQHKLVTSGPYQYVQHPGYLSFLGTVVGVGIFTEFALINLYPVIMFFIVVSGIPVEEEMLQAEFGAEYTSYQKGRARILPGIF